MSRAMATALFACTAVAGLAQDLVPNGGFESFSQCPIGFSQFAGFVNNWTDPNTASPDYYNACANPNPAGVPHNGTGWQQAHSGTAYAGFYTSPGTLYREFIQVHLAQPMVAGTTYAVKFFVVLHDKSRFATDDIGAYFSTTAPTSTTTGLLAGNPQPQVANPMGMVLADSLNWQPVIGQYTATGGEQYLTIGHFRSDAQTLMQQVDYGSQGAYYYVDDVSVLASVGLPVELLFFSAKAEGDVIRTSWSTATERNNSGFVVQRSLDGSHFEDVGTVPGAGDAQQQQDYGWDDRDAPAGRTLYYRLEQRDLDGATTLSEVVTAWRAGSGALDAVLLMDGSVRFTWPEETDLQLALFAADGRLLAARTMHVLAGSNRSPGLAPDATGIVPLILRITTPTQQRYVRLVPALP